MCTLMKKTFRRLDSLLPLNGCPTIQIHPNPESITTRNILDVLQSSLMDHPDDAGAENEVRYKLIIDPSEDGSLVRLLFSAGVLQRCNTRVYICSDFPGGSEMQKVLFQNNSGVVLE